MRKVDRNIVLLDKNSIQSVFGGVFHCHCRRWYSERAWFKWIIVAGYLVFSIFLFAAAYTAFTAEEEKGFFKVAPSVEESKRLIASGMKPKRFFINLINTNVDNDRLFNKQKESVNLAFKMGLDPDNPTIKHKNYLTTRG